MKLMEFMETVDLMKPLNLMELLDPHGATGSHEASGYHEAAGSTDMTQSNETLTFVILFGSIAPQGSMGTIVPRLPLVPIDHGVQ